MGGFRGQQFSFGWLGTSFPIIENKETEVIWSLMVGGISYFYGYDNFMW